MTVFVPPMSPARNMARVSCGSNSGQLAAPHGTRSARPLHLFECLALRLADGNPREEERKHGSSRVLPVSTRQAGPLEIRGPGQTLSAATPAGPSGRAMPLGGPLT